MDDRVSFDPTELEVACYCLHWLRRMLADFASEAASARRYFSRLSDKWMSTSGFLNDDRNHFALETILLLIDRSFPILKKCDSKLRAFVGFRSLILCGDVDGLAERTAEVLSFTDEILKAEGDFIPEDRHEGVAKYVLATMAERSLESSHTREARWTESLLQCNQREVASKQGNEITETISAEYANHGNLVTNVDIHAAISMLRHLSDEFKEARRIPANERMEVAKSIGVRASETLTRCWNLGYLRSIPSLQKRFDDLRNQANSTPGFLGEIWFRMYFLSELVGYGNAVVERVVDNEVGTNEEGEEVIYECSKEYLYLRSGILAKDRFLITPDIFIGPVPMSEGEIATAASKHGFEVLGYYAQGCEVLAEIVEQEAVSTSDHMVIDASRPEDGLIDENRRLIWGGIQFTLTTNQAMVFRLLVEAYPNDVLVSQFEDIGVRVLRDSFRRKNAEGKNEYDPLWYLIGSGSRKDSKRMVDPKVARNDPRIISQSPT
jgi:hypothetical protein